MTTDSENFYDYTVIEDDGNTYSERAKATDILDAFIKAIEYNSQYVKSVFIAKIENKKQGVKK